MGRIHLRQQGHLRVVTVKPDSKQQLNLIHLYCRAITKCSKRHTMMDCYYATSGSQPSTTSLIHQGLPLLAAPADIGICLSRQMLRFYILREE
eukprot:scaffold6339_cov17-Prasinocladus_malaysianus.AAC.1